MTSAQPTLLTVVVNYRTPDLTLQAVAAALREMQGIAGEIVIVDNSSGDGSYETLLTQTSERGWSTDERVRVIRSASNGGFGAGNNLAIRSGFSDGGAPDYVYVLNSDAYPDPGAIRALIDYLQANPKVGLAGSYIHGPDGAPHVTAFRFPSMASEFEGAACTGVISRLLSRSIVPLPLPHRTLQVDWLAGASMMIRGDVLEEIGSFDEAYFLYFEETDLCRRASRAGWSTVYVRESSVTHIGSVSTGMKTWVRTPSYWFDSRQRYFRKNHGSAYSGLATLAHAMGALLYRARVLLSNKPRVDPPFFLRDLIGHALRTSIHGPGRRAAIVPQQGTAPCATTLGGNE